MGEPAQPSEADRAATRARAARIVQSVVEDEPMPHGLTWYAMSHQPGATRYFDRDAVEDLAFRLAQEIERLRVDLNEACDIAIQMSNLDQDRQRDCVIGARLSERIAELRKAGQ